MWIYIEMLIKEYNLTKEQAEKVYEIMNREKLFKKAR